MQQMHESKDNIRGEVKMIEVGRLCVKTAGRDARKQCVVVEVLDKNFVMIDGETRRRKCNIDHLEPLNQKLEISSGASHDKVAKAFKEMGVEVKETTSKASSEKPKKVRASAVAAASESAKSAKSTAAPKKAVKKATKKASE